MTRMRIMACGLRFASQVMLCSVERAEFYPDLFIWYLCVRIALFIVGVTQKDLWSLLHVSG